MMKRFILSLLLILPTLASAQEVITSYDNSTLAVINEELRQSSAGVSSVRKQIADLLPLNLASPTSVTGVLPVANGGTNATSLTDIGLPSQTGNSGKYLTTNGSASSWGSISVVPVYEADPLSIISSNATERTTSSGTYTKLKETAVYGSGVVTVAFDWKMGGAGFSFFRIYKNGVAAGTEQCLSGTSYANYSENISVANGDLIQVYAKRDTPSIYIKNLNIYGSQSTKNASY
jgi:hypothetical protein